MHVLEIQFCFITKFVCPSGDPGTGKVNKSTESVRTSQSHLSQYSSVVGGELHPSKGYDFEDWNWPIIRCRSVTTYTCVGCSVNFNNMCGKFFQMNWFPALPLK